MQLHYIDEKTGISYTLQGDYYLPNLTLPVRGEKPIDRMMRTTQTLSSLIHPLYLIFSL